MNLQKNQINYCPTCGQHVNNVQLNIFTDVKVEQPKPYTYKQILTLEEVKITLNACIPNLELFSEWEQQFVISLTKFPDFILKKLSEKQENILLNNIMPKLLEKKGE